VTKDTNETSEPHSELNYLRPQLGIASENGYELEQQRIERCMESAKDDLDEAEGRSAEVAVGQNPDPDKMLPRDPVSS
jgi:hypothetical protein